MINCPDGFDARNYLSFIRSIIYMEYKENFQ
jgi:hypothetical protein